MYKNGLVAVIKVGGRVLRETKDVVYVPFGSEYSVLIKNLKTKRVLINMAIDGTDAFDGTQIVIPANSEVELERFIRNGNLNSGNKFKFIERTEAIEEFRGVKSDDGLIRIEYWTEKVHDPMILVNNAWKYEFGTNYRNPYGNFRSFNSLDDSYSFNDVSTCGLTYCAFNQQSLEPVNGAGITVAGSQSNQTFGTCGWFETEPQSEVLILKMCGKTETQKVVKPITVQMKKVCVTCGKKSHGNVSFCPQCGTALNLI
jgi:hypothetical protein